MAAGIGNPVGYTPVLDGGVPRIIGGLAGTNLSGGTYVYASGGVDNVSSGLGTYTTNDIIWLGDASGILYTGVLIQDTGSNTYGAVATRGAVISLADGTVTAGQLVTIRGGNAVANAAGSFHAFNFPIARALTSAGSETFAIVQLGL